MALPGGLCAGRTGLVGGYAGVVLAKWALDVHTPTGDSFVVPVAATIAVVRRIQGAPAQSAADQEETLAPLQGVLGERGTSQISST